jgi:hypothetical protein
MSVNIVVYCPRCDYFKKSSVSGPIGTHGCMKCGAFMEVYIPQEMGKPDYEVRHDG